MPDSIAGVVLALRHHLGIAFGAGLSTLMRKGALSEAESVSKALQWVKLDYVRHAATLIAWLAALKAFSLLSKVGG